MFARLSPVACGACLLLVAGPARAEHDAPSEPETRWYGWQTALTDAAAIGLVLYAAEFESNQALGAAVFSYYLGAPIVHWAHGHTGKGFMSLGIRAGATLTAALVVSSCFGDGGCGGLEIVAVSIGLMLVPIPLDAALLAHEEVEPAKPRIGLVPIVTPTTRGLGLRARF